ncbi:MAG: NAD(P)H-hydrate dehydratase [Alphaproteobacteria bacterium]
MKLKDNRQEHWIDLIPRAGEEDHKYTRGQVFVAGGRDMTGAACLAADAAAKAGAGLVNIVVLRLKFHEIINPHIIDPLPVYKGFRPYIITRRCPDIVALLCQAQIKGRAVGVIGPGLGSNDYKEIRRIILHALEGSCGQPVIPIVLDADGLNAFGGDAYRAHLYRAVHSSAVLTPHDGEFKKLFPSLSSLLKDNREKAAYDAAQMLDGGVLVLKGHNTIIAQQADGEVHMVVNNVTSPYLATAGSGDVLSGVIAGLMAQGMPAFQAGAAGVWIHGKAAQNIGLGLVAADLIDNIPEVLKEMLGI